MYCKFHYLYYFLAWACRQKGAGMASVHFSPYPFSPATILLTYISDPYKVQGRVSAEMRGRTGLTWLASV